MKSYILKPKFVRKSEIESKEYSLSGFSFRKINNKNDNIFFLKDENILSKNIKGFESGSAEYINFSNNCFVRISEMEDLNFIFDTSNNTKKIRPVKNSNKLKLIRKGDICYQTASNVGNVCIYNNSTPAYYNSHIRKLEFKKDKYYIFAILKSSFGRQQVDVAGSIKGVDNFREEYLLNTKIPFPTKNSHPEPQKIEQLVSLIVQNIINKEEQIKVKNQKIDELIEKELKENQNTNNSFKYSYPKISEIKQETRLDTGIYEREFKEIDFLIKNYKGEFNRFDDLGLIVSRGQNLQISNIGSTLYSKKKINDKFFKLILSKHFGNRTIEETVYLGSNENLKQIKKGDIIFSCRGEMGRSYFFPEIINEKVITNIDNVHISSNLKQYKQCFVFCFLGYLKLRNFIDNLACTGSGAPSLTQYHFNKFKIPNFPEPKQQEIAKEYYNKIDKNQNLTLENYLQKEIARNQQIGIFQINMEIFELREQLGEIIDKIINDLPIEINLN